MNGSWLMAHHDLNLGRYISRMKPRKGLAQKLSGRVWLRPSVCLSQCRLYRPTSPRESRKDFVLYDSLSETTKEMPQSGNKGFAWYTCGPTTYAPAHLGHARTYVCVDILRRVLEHHTKRERRTAPLFVLNITDVDDKILAAATSQNEPPLQLARRFERDFWRDWDDLNCLRPHVITRVSEHVDSEIVPYIERIWNSGMAYENEDGVYFDLRAYEEKLGTVSKYGKLAPPAAGSDFFLLDSSEKQDKGATSKKDTRDFVLWKKRKEGEALYWSSPWGEGRPGWHIECSAMIESVSKIFNETHVFAFHAGGIDLKFPHHTNEIAQAEAFHSERLRQQPFQEWIPHWIHTGHLHIDGLKMSKSLKNFISIEELLSQGTESPLSCPADDFRLWCLGLSGSYRAPATYSSQRIDEARKIREKFVQFLIDASEWIRKRDDSSIKAWTTLERDFWTEVHNYFKQSHEALENDMDGASFVKELMKVVEAGNSYMRSSPTKTTEALRDSVTLLRELLALVGFSEKTVFAGVVRKGQKGATEEGIVGGEPVLITEVVSFRRRIRDAALSHVQEQATSALAKEILGVCDEARDRILPSIGLQLVDGKAEEESGYAWRFCIPRVEDTASQMQNYQESKAPIPLSDVALVDFFKTGRYEGMFSQYDEDGIPTKNADGSDISNRLMKKLQKKREKHQRKVDEK